MNEDRRLRQPSGCIEDRPTKQSISFGGKFINVSAICRAQNIDQPTLSRVFSGKRKCSVDMAIKLAAALGMGLEEFIASLKERLDYLAGHTDAQLVQYYERIASEDLQDADLISQGHPPAIRLPGLRLQK